ncbi:MAG: recombinase family protein [Desulfobacteraceae bacterium]|nr:recombinase family protein [Desulfobacteraceae bacterium]
MNEFLRNLRSQQKDKYPGSYRSPSDGNTSYPHPDRRSGGDRRSGSSSRNFNPDLIIKKLSEIYPDIKHMLGSVTEANEKIIEALDRHIEIEEERNEIFESIGRSLEIIAEKGIIPYDSDHNESMKVKKIPKEEKDKILDLIVSMRENNSTYEQIADYLESERIPTFSNKGHWHAQTIHRLYQQRKAELES